MKLKNLKNLKFILIVATFCCHNLTAITLEVWTIPEALNYSGDKNAITKLLVKGEIEGNDYSEGSHWREFRTLDQTFPNIHSVEIWTDQNIPDNHLVSDSCALYLFSKFLFEWDDNGVPINYASLWLKHFSAPNVRIVGGAAFIGCKNLLSVNFPVAEKLAGGGSGGGVFAWCESLEEINLPKTKLIGNGSFHKNINLKSCNFSQLEIVEWGIFIGCTNLTTVTIGTAFEEETSVYLGRAVFGGMHQSVSPILTPNIDLTLGEYVLPKPDTVFNIWQGTNDAPQYYQDYIWKSINIQKVGINEIIKNATVNIYPNPASSNATVSFELEKPCYLELNLYDLTGKQIKEVFSGFAAEGLFTQTVKLSQLSAGVYYLKITDGKFSTMEKIILN